MNKLNHTGVTPKPDSIISCDQEAPLEIVLPYI